MTSLIQTFQERFADWLVALGQHLQISLFALLLAIVLAIPLAIILTNYPRLRQIAVQIAGVFQTIPSLALLGLLIPILGIGTGSAVTALVVYGMFPILQNTLTGLVNLDPNLVEAAKAFGMTKWERLKKFELALAMPVIISGIRTSAVLIIGTATLAALIGAGGLGSFILLGIDRHNMDLILIGAISSALLAILFSSFIAFLEKKPLKQIFLAFLVLIMALGASYGPKYLNKMTGQSDELVIAGKLGPEPEILINMYKLLIEDQTDLSVRLEPNFGKTSFLYEALKAKQVDIYPEFTGTIAYSLLADVPPTSTDPEEVYRLAKEGIAEQDQLDYLLPMQYQNTYALAMQEDLAQDQHIEKISDLKKIEKQIQAGFTLEFNDRPDGNLGLQSKYDLNLQVSTFEPALRYQAIQEGQIQLIDAYSTDSELLEYGLRVLEDDQQLFPPYQGAPLLRPGLLKDHPELEDCLNQLAGKISEEEMRQMNYQVKVDGKSAAEVAEEYLKSQNLLSH